MTQEIKLSVYYTEDGELWGVFAYDHINPSLITGQMIADAVKSCCDDLDELPYGGFEIEHLAFEKRGDGEEEGSFWCEPDAPGAILVTGVRF